jgi:UDP-2,4-diacetamido-2,4,6-trideoxy-beta-L-altropyranose hydrolase
MQVLSASTKMHFIFRADSSVDIGTGHVMRCMTLAGALREDGHECSFICKNHKGNINAQIIKNGFYVDVLERLNPSEVDNRLDLSLPPYHPWLGSSWLCDAKTTKKILMKKKPDWLIVDHYALDKYWHKYVLSSCENIMVIDDLADRQHHCKILLDQTLGRETLDYKGLIPDQCDMLLGSDYSLLRSEFVEYRSLSFRRRERPALKYLLVTMGGTDSLNATGLILTELVQSDLPDSLKIIVVMGSNSPFLEDVRMQAETIRFDTSIKVDVSNMAYLMARSDLVVGAAGTTSWERCCLGVPSVMVVLADNQRNVAKALSVANAALLIESVEHIAGSLGSMVEVLSKSPDKLEKMSFAARRITNGTGADKVAEVLRVSM